MILRVLLPCTVCMYQVSGTEGGYRSTATAVMRVLRAKSDSLNAMLEAFVHDPLIGWKLLHAADAPDTDPDGVDEDGGATQRGKNSNSNGEGGRANDESDSEDDMESRSASRDADESDLSSVTSRERMRRGRVERPGGRERRRSKSQQFKPSPGGSSAEASSTGSSKTVEAGKAESSNSMRKSSKSTYDSAERSVVEKTAAEIEASKLSALLHVSTIEVNEQAMRVTRRIQLKLDGREFADEGDFSSSSHNSIFSTGSNSSGGAGDVGEVGVEEQVDRLIKQARAHENLAQMFVGWCGFW